jgi:hypothetical protein
MDAIYQIMVLKTFHPGEAAIVAMALALLRWPNQASRTSSSSWGDDIGWFNISTYDHSDTAHPSPPIA